MFSLKSKILLGIFILLAATVSFNLYYSYNLFVADKRAYIFESALKRSENLGDQIKLEYNQMLQTMKLFEEFKNQNAKNLKIISSQSKSLAFSFTFSSDDFSLIDKSAFSDNSTYKIKLNESDIEEFVFRSIREQKLSRKVQFMNLNGEPFFSLANDNGSTIRVLIFTARPVLELLATDQLFSNSLFVSNEKNMQLALGTGIGQNIASEIVKSSLFKGAREIVHNKEKQLIAYVYFPNEGILISSSMPSAKAFEVTKNLIYKTIFFAFALLGGAIVFGTLFSSSITKPILSLSETSQALAQRNFDVRSNVKTNDELKILSDSFNFMAEEVSSLLKEKQTMIDELNKAKAQLEDYSHNLEKMVAQRTAELKNANDFMSAMVNSLDQGLVVFDQDLKCHDIYTKACEKVFGNSPHNKYFYEILEESGKKKFFEDWSKITFGNRIPFESAIGLMPHEKTWGDHYSNENFRSITLNYFPMSDDDHLKNIVVVATDKTKEIIYNEQFKEKEAFVLMILKILSNKGHFASFVDEVYAILEKLDNLHQEGITKEELLKGFMINFHTLNGGFGLFSITHLQKQAVESEMKISEFMKTNDNVEEVVLKKLVLDLKKSFENYLEDLKNNAGLAFNKNKRSIEIEKEKVLRLKTLIDSVGDTTLKDTFYEDFLLEPAINYFKIYDKLMQTIADRTGKLVSPLELKGADVLIPAEKYSDFFNSMVHLFRNCVDHGIESPEKRRAQGKDPAGKITVQFEKTKNELQIIVKDDGQGIDPNLIRKKFEQSKIEVSENDQEIIYRIFDPNFSTREEVSAFSGRGVGMSAIKEALEKVGGQIILNSKVGSGSEFRFILPIS